MLVGNSLGGFVAAEAVTAAPGRFDRLVLVSAAGIVNTWRPEQRAVATTLAWKGFASTFGRSRMKAMLHRPRWGQLMIGPFVHQPTRLQEELIYEQVMGSLPSHAFGDALHATISHDIRDRLPKVEIPTQIVWGFYDRIIPVQAALSFRRRIPGSRLEIFERTGHLAQLERPSRFNALLDDFLTS
jgi:pimeloyl-ACP methyl ester carboxylesterase